MDIGLLEYCKIGFEYCWRGLFYCRIGLEYCRMGSEYSRIELEYCIIDYYRVQLEYCRIGLEYCSIEWDYCRVEEYCRIEREKLEAHQSKVFILSHLTSLQEGTCGQNRTIELFFPRLAHTTPFQTSKSQTIFVIPLRVCSESTLALRCLLVEETCKLVKGKRSRNSRFSDREMQAGRV